MKRRFTETYLLALLTGLVLAGMVACAGAGGETQPAQPPSPEQFTRGAKAWAQVCQRCHNLRNPKELTDEDWEVSVTHMRVRANLPGGMAEDIKVFLKASN